MDKTAEEMAELIMELTNEDTPRFIHEQIAINARAKAYGYLKKVKVNDK